MTKIIKKEPNPIDKHVGSRVRMRRLIVSMSQEKLGERLGLTFQQVQKYEKGMNRIGASRLQHICEILGVPVSFFFEGAPNTEKQIISTSGVGEIQNLNIDDTISNLRGLKVDQQVFIGGMVAQLVEFNRFNVANI